MALGIGRLGLSSADFWKLTPRELSAAIGTMHGGASEPPARAVLDDLMRRYPDAKGHP
jgi:uncharacterized phage protein (TIGR02216 family)